MRSGVHHNIIVLLCCNRVSQGNVFFSQVTHVIIDEVDTLLTQGFGADVRCWLYRVCHALFFSMFL